MKGCLDGKGVFFKWILILVFLCPLFSGGVASGSWNYVRREREVLSVKEKQEMREWVMEQKQKRIGIDLERLYDRSNPKIKIEAETLAGVIVKRIMELQDEYDVALFRGFQNLLVKLGLRKKGFCFHWTQDLLQTIFGKEWSYFDFYWAGAYVHGLREHNVVVIVKKGDSLEKGILMDPWRHGGRLYWTDVARDHYPWKIRPLPSPLPTTEPLFPLE